MKRLQKNYIWTELVQIMIGNPLVQNKAFKCLPLCVSLPLLRPHFLVDKARQLAGRADAPRELFSSRRSFCAICCQYGWAWFQLHLRDEYARASIYAWRPLLSMRIRSSSSPQLVLRPADMPNPRRSRAQKTGAPTCEKGVRCAGEPCFADS